MAQSQTLGLDPLIRFDLRSMIPRPRIVPLLHDRAAGLGHPGQTICKNIIVTDNGRSLELALANANFKEQPSTNLPVSERTADRHDVLSLGTKKIFHRELRDQ
jgi:hypothetical protein